MKSKEFNSAIKGLERVRLAAEDKQAIFSTVKRYAATHPVPEKAGVLTEILEMVKAALGIRFRF